MQLSGASSDGFKTIVQPAAIAGTTFIHKKIIEPGNQANTK
jgi:hypothetical protein